MGWLNQKAGLPVPEALADVLQKGPGMGTVTPPDGLKVDEPAAKLTIHLRGRGVTVSLHYVIPGGGSPDPSPVAAGWRDRQRARRGAVGLGNAIGMNPGPELLACHLAAVQAVAEPIHRLW